MAGKVKFEYKIYAIPVGANADIDYKEGQLNLLGAAGWEVVSTWPENVQHRPSLLLKRSIQPAEPGEVGSPLHRLE